MGRVAIITGASSGIGQELCRQLINQDYYIGMIARREDVLHQIKQELCPNDDRLLYFAADVVNQGEIAKAMDYFMHSFGKVDLVVANAGIAGSLPIESFDTSMAKKIIDVNVVGLMNTVGATLPIFIKQKSGHIVTISSLASFISPAKSYVYSASKAAVNTFIKGVALEGYRYNINVTNVCPGYIKTPITERNRFPMPFIMDVDQAAKRIIHSIHRKHKRLVFPRRLYLIIKIISFLPDSIQRKIFSAG